MSSLIRWEPLRDFVSLRDAMDRLFEESFTAPPRGWIAPLSAAELAMDLYETPEDVTIKAALPGIKPEDVEITITGNTLHLRGESKEENEIKDKNYLRRERRYGSFERTIALPGGLQADKAEATFENGVLTLRVPKSEQTKTKTIKVKTK
ncbi:MAG: Hsp20/alpha crystallin family protein [Chloroflexi bacterium]|nr:Hsp20/alpha crystallin family protein [Chloroflexota bacterium]